MNMYAHCQCLLPFVADFFRFAFDGSGADNFYDAGSCIDGRLTSAWNCKKNIGNIIKLLRILIVTEYFRVFTN